MTNSLLLFLTLGLLSCSLTHLEQMDRSKVNSKALQAENFSALKTLSPHSNLRSNQSSAAGCSTCAH